MRKSIHISISEKDMNQIERDLNRLAGLTEKGFITYAKHLLDAWKQEVETHSVDTGLYADTLGILDANQNPEDSYIVLGDTSGHSGFSETGGNHYPGEQNALHAIERMEAEGSPFKEIADAINQRLSGSRTPEPTRFRLPNTPFTQKNLDYGLPKPKTQALEKRKK